MILRDVGWDSILRAVKDLGYKEMTYIRYGDRPHPTERWFTVERPSDFLGLYPSPLYNFFYSNGQVIQYSAETDERLWTLLLR